MSRPIRDKVRVSYVVQSSYRSVTAVKESWDQRRVDIYIREGDQELTKRLTADEWRALCNLRDRVRVRKSGDAE